MKRLTDKMNDLAVKGYVKGMQVRAKLAEVFTRKSGEGLMDGLRRRWRDTPAGMACRVEPIRAKASACSLSFHGT